MQVAVAHHGYMEPYTDYFALILSQPIEKTGTRQKSGQLKPLNANAIGLANDKAI
jgi:hypothetical protein